MPSPEPSAAPPVVQNPRLERFTVGNVLRVSAGVFFNNAPSFFLLTLTLYLPLIVLAAVLVHNGSPLVYQSSRLAWTLFGAAIGVFFSSFAAATVMYAAVSELRGERASFGASLRVGFKRLPAVFGVSSLVGLLLVLGIYSYIVPGLLVAAIMWVTVPAAVIERTGVMGSIKRSDRLTNRLRWPIIALVLLIWVGDLLLHLLVLAVCADSITGTGGALLCALLFIGTSVLTSAFSAVVTAVGYYSLRIVKERIELNALARAFD